METVPDIPVLFLDEDLLGVNKPSGVLTIPDGYNPAAPHLRTLLESRFGRLWIVHRLDKETSGVVLLARNQSTHKSLSLQFENRLVHKTYHAIIIGSPPWQRLEIDIPLRVNGDRQHRTVPAQLTGKPASTTVEILNRYEGYCLIAAYPSTGYTHQIRAHLAASGFPILGDRLYSKNDHTIPQLPIQRVALHANCIKFTHPALKKPQVISASYPPDFGLTISTLEHLRN